MSKSKKKYIDLCQLANKYKQVVLDTLWYLEGNVCKMGCKNSVRHHNKALHFILNLLYSLTDVIHELSITAILILGNNI